MESRTIDAESPAREPDRLTRGREVVKENLGIFYRWSKQKIGNGWRFLLAIPYFRIIKKLLGRVVRTLFVIVVSFIGGTVFTVWLLLSNAQLVGDELFRLSARVMAFAKEPNVERLPATAWIPPSGKPSFEPHQERVIKEANNKKKK